MRNKAFISVSFISVLLFLVAVISATAREPIPELTEATLVPVDGSENQFIRSKIAADQDVYIVRLEDAPLASYLGGVQGLDATSPKATGAIKLNMQSLDTARYRAFLAEKQANFITLAEQNVTGDLDVIYQYDVAYNGVALSLTAAEASALSKLPGVAQVQRSEWRQVQTDVAAPFIGADKIWDGSVVSGPGTKGEGVIVGIIDTGIWPEHPSFADDGTFLPPPADWKGECSAPQDGTEPITCNNKLIGARYFVDVYSLAVGGYDGLFYSGRDDNGHGTHTASTAAGNEDVAVKLLGLNRGRISGIAPRAHVASYKGLGPQGGVTADLVAAIDAAVADGVDVINYSIGGETGDPWRSADAQAFLAARDAGVFVATSAGNSGPDADTIGSPGNAPWITTVGASTSNRQFLSDVMLAGPDDPPQGLFGASLTEGVKNFNLVDAEGIPDVSGDDSGRCINPYPAGTFTANDVVLCERGVVARVVRGDNVKAGGGGAVILYNAVAEQGLSTDNYVIPAVHVIRATGLAIKSYLAAHPGEVTVSFTTGRKMFEGADDRVKSDMMAGFSSRGPNGTVPDVIKPDITAPGVQTLAGNTPQCFSPDNACGALGELFQAIQGTSMSSPHVAGAAALIVALHPDWSPAEIESAIMTTANKNHVKEDGKTPADPFDMGGGRIDVALAANAPLTLHETMANYLASDPAQGGDPKTLNKASLINSSCVLACSWTRTVKNSTDMKITWDMELDGLPGSVVPKTFTLQPGSTQEISVAVDVSALEQDKWHFATLLINPRTGSGVPKTTPSSQLPIAVSPSALDARPRVVIDTRRDSGSSLLEDLIAIEVTNLTLNPFGLVPAENYWIKLMKDETPDFPYDNLEHVWFITSEVPQGSTRFVNEVLASTAPDADLFVGFDSNGNGKPDLNEEVCASTSPSWNEYCSIDLPEPGTWWVLVQNWESSHADALDSIRLATAIVPSTDAGNLSFDAPSSLPPLSPFDITIKYDLADTYPGQAWYGSFSISSDGSSNGDIGEVNIDLHRLEDDVAKTVSKPDAFPGETLVYTITINSNTTEDDLEYLVVDTIPDGLRYVEGSATATQGNLAVEGNQLAWTGTIPSAASLAPTYVISTSKEDQSCNILGGGYYNLEDEGFFAQPGVSGNNKVYRLFDSGNPINFYGVNHTGMYITDDGFAVFDSTNNLEQNGQPQDIPNPAKPNNIVAMLWQNMEILYDQALNKGISAVRIGDDIMIVEYDDVQLLDDSGNTYDFEIVMRRTVNDDPGQYEIVLGYDNIRGTLSGPLTIGTENATGNAASAFVNNGSAVGQITDGMMICFDWKIPSTEVIITYETIIDEEVQWGELLTNTVTSTTNQVNSKEETNTASVFVGNVVQHPIIRTVESK